MSKRVLVTGSSRGIGLGIARGLAKDGFQLVLHGRSASRSLDEAVSNLSPYGARSITFDLEDREQTRSVLEAEVKENGAFYGVVLSAGITKDMPFPAIADSDWDRVLRTNLDSFYSVLQPLIMPMIRLRAGGRIVVLSSISGLHGNRGQVNYSAAKAGLIGAAKALSLELARRKISVNCIAPGGVETGMINDELRKQMTRQIPMRRLARVDEVAAAASYLFSPASEYMTGQTLVLSGGLG